MGCQGKQNLKYFLFVLVFLPFFVCFLVVFLFFFAVHSTLGSSLPLRLFGSSVSSTLFFMDLRGLSLPIDCIDMDV